MLAMLPVDDRWQCCGQWLCNAEVKTTDTAPVWTAALSVLRSLVKFAVPRNTLLCGHVDSRDATH